MKIDPSFPRPPFSNEVEIVYAERVKANKSKKNKKVRYTLRSIVNSPSFGIACTCNDSQKLGQSFKKAGSDRKRAMEHGIYGMWEIESIMENPQRWKCSHCGGRFNHEYEFIGKGKKYTKQCREIFSSVAEISSAKKAAKLQGIPTRTGHTIFFEEYLPRKRREREKEAIRRALAQGHCLKISIDDTSTRKGKKYASYIYDATTKALLAVIEGRTYEDLMAYWQQNPHLHELDPAVVTMDRAPAYIKFAKAVFPNALIVFDRFHIIKNIRDLALHPSMRSTFRDKRFAPTIKQLSLDLIWKNYRGELSDHEKLMLQKILTCSKKLKKKYDEMMDLMSFYEEKEKFFPKDFFVFRWELACRLHHEWVECMHRELKNGRYLSSIREFIKKSLSKRYREGLSEPRRLLLERILQLANWYGLGEAYELIEEVGRWYDTNFSTFVEAYNDLHAIIGKWLQHHDHKGIKKGAESLQRGQQSIANYHRGDRATNALVEGKNCVTKLEFRQRFGVRSWRNYENLSIVCRNAHLEDEQGEDHREVS